MLRDQELEEGNWVKSIKPHVTSCSFSPPYWISWTKVQSTWPLSICNFLQIARTPLCSLRLIPGAKNSRIRWRYKRLASSCHLFFLGYRTRNKTRCWSFSSCPLVLFCVSKVMQFLKPHDLSSNTVKYS